MNDVVVFDIEANGFNPDRIHCLSYKYVNSEEVVTLTDYIAMRAFLNKNIQLVGHNIMSYDIPVLEKILGVEIPRKKCWDSLPLSWYIYDAYPRHGLEDWGERFGIPKPKITDWDSLTIEEYSYRCEEDVKINSQLWDNITEFLLDLYGSVEAYTKLVNYLSFKMYCASLQQNSRWKLDIKFCKESLAKLKQEHEDKFQTLFEAMPQQPIYKTKNKPKKPFKQSGELSESGKSWFELLEREGLPKDHQDPVKFVDSYTDPNPGSVPQVKDWLFNLGWKPDEFKHVRNKETNEFRKIPQINLQNPGEVGVSQSVRDLFTKEPALESLDLIYVIKHRIGILEGFLKDVDEDGYIIAGVQGLTNTLRFKHRTAVNLPGVNKPYGELIRGCLVAPKGYVLCGSDMSSLEDRTKQHYMWEYDPEFVKDQMSPDFDPHLDLALMGELMTAEEVAEYRSDKKHSEKRHDAKQVNYSCTYGVTPKGLVRNTGMPLERAANLHQAYWKRNWSIMQIANNCKVKNIPQIKFESNRSWLYNPVSKLWYYLKVEKDRFSTLNQGAGSYAFDMWVKHILKRRKELTAQFHDEVVLCVKHGEEDKVRNILLEAIKACNKELNLNRELDIDIQFGGAYSEIH